ncbi:MAG: NUDIX domain-containing protein, partial [Micrococcales bacterium]|nr:NUDIX domain-containing protein [Micrococcales bacterium]
WWFTVGGGLDAGETARAAAVRELREETGIELVPDELVGPVYTRSALFDFAACLCHQDEELFVARVDSSGLPPLSRADWTDAETDVLDELRWWSLPDLSAVDIEVFPVDLPHLIAALLPVWDGVTRHLGLARET